MLQLQLFAREVFVVDESGNIIEAECVAEVTSKPNYKAALAAKQRRGEE